MIYFGLVFLMVIMSTYLYNLGHKNGQSVGRRQVLSENIVRLKHQNMDLQEEANKWRSSM